MNSKQIVFVATVVALTALTVPNNLAQAGPKAKVNRVGHSFRQTKANFGGIVSREAKIWKTAPKPGFRNFGDWVSSQRKHKHKRNAPEIPRGDSPVTPTVPTTPVDVAIPTVPTSPSVPTYPTDGTLVPPTTTFPSPYGGMGT